MRYTIAAWMAFAPPAGSHSRPWVAVHEKHADRLMVRQFGVCIYG